MSATRILVPLLVLLLLVLAVLRQERTILLSVKDVMMNTFMMSDDEAQLTAVKEIMSSGTVAAAMVDSTPRRLSVVQIGANDGSLQGNDDIVRTLLLSNTTDAILVEANPKIFELLLQTVADTYQNDPRITPIHALICPEGSNLTFYAVNDTRLKADFPRAPHWVLHQLSSLDRDSITRGLRGFLAGRSRAAAQNMKAYLITIPIPCTPFAKVIHQSNLSPESVDVVAVDVEGHDARVLTEAFQVPGFLPRLIVFEAKIVATDFPSELQDVVNLLQERGYTTDCTRNNEKWKCPSDVLATQGAPVRLNSTHCVTQSTITTSCT